MTNVHDIDRQRPRFQAKVTAAIVAGVVITAVNLATGIYSAIELNRVQAIIRYSQRLITELDDLLLLIKEIEGAQHTYALT